MGPRSPALTLAVLVVLTGLLTPGTAASLGTRDSAALNAMKSFAAGKNGIVVWQTRRTGPLRIYACNLDGSNLRQISADVSGYDQIAPMISPDGKWIIYYQTKTLIEGTFYKDHVGSMVLIKSDDTTGKTSKILLNEVRTFFECRFARWIDNDTIAYVGKDHDGYTYSISLNKSTKIFDYPLGDFGAIPNVSLTYAIDGKNRVFSLSGGNATQKKDYDGCEGNIATDNKWAYRVKGSSHDFTRMKLGSWSEEVFFNNHDSALPSSQSYIYFPQISPCRKYLAFGASPDQHNHFTSDYDIFVVPIDPVTFKKTGKAVKYSFSNKLDSYPDIWVGGTASGCTSNAECDDKDPCTTNACKSSKCVYTPISGCCTTDSDCDDGNSCTTDSCASNSCENKPIAGCCKSDADCADSDACTVDSCDVSTGLCANTTTPGCCTLDTHHTCDDGDPCTTDTCDTSSNTCANTQISPCGGADGGAFDGGVPGVDGSPPVGNDAPAFNAYNLVGGCHLGGPAASSLTCTVLLIPAFLLLWMRRRS